MFLSNYIMQTFVLYRKRKALIFITKYDTLVILWLKIKDYEQFKTYENKTWDNARTTCC